MENVFRNVCCFCDLKEHAEKASSIIFSMHDAQVFRKFYLRINRLNQDWINWVCHPNAAWHIHNWKSRLPLPDDDAHGKNASKPCRIGLDQCPAHINKSVSKAIGIIINRNIDDALIWSVLDRIINQVKDNRVNGWLKRLYFNQVNATQSPDQFLSPLPDWPVAPRSSVPHH